MIDPKELLGAIARAWCHPTNIGKEMDPNLAISIAAEVNALLPYEADQRHVTRMEDDLLAIAETVQPKPGQDSMDYAMIVSSIRHIFEADEDFYINLAARVRGRNAPDQP